MALEQFRLDGQVAIVTGAGRGVGRGITRVLSEAGAIVVGTARSPGEVTETIAEIERNGGEGLALTADATSRPDNTRVVNTVMERFGRVDILVNNAGGATLKRILDLTDEAFKYHFEWNTVSAFILTQLVAPHMLKAGKGSIINISSTSARIGVRGRVAYCVAKGALEQLTRAAAKELAPKIRVNCIALGTFMTDALRGTFDLMPNAEAKMKEFIPLHRIGDVEDLGRLILYLSSRDCYATNSIFHVDGGIETSPAQDDRPDY